MTAATMKQLNDLFIHVTRPGAPSNNVSVFLKAPATYISNNNLSGITLSARQLQHLTNGAAIANELQRVMKIGDTKRPWLPGAVAVTAACRPAYSGRVFTSAYPGVEVDVMPGDPLAAMLWGWDDYSDSEQGYIRLLIKAAETQQAIPPDIREVCKELSVILAAPPA
ncbi:MAG: hypothetical protein NTZ11_17205 [Gammaproteobacteria bacterium]|nr:hypothetical protein [Gammaproteobacteria bacterium]